MRNLTIALFAVVTAACGLVPQVDDVGEAEQPSSAGVCGEPPLRCNPDDPAAQAHCEDVCSEEGGDGFCPPYTTAEIAYCARHCKPDGISSTDPTRCGDGFSCSEPILLHVCTFGSRA